METDNQNIFRFLHIYFYYEKESDSDVAIQRAKRGKN